MKKGVFVILALCLLAAPVPRAGTLTIFGPKTLTRTTGSPNVFNFTFVTGAATGPFLLHIDNHGVTSAVVTLNGVEILGPDECKATRSDDWKKRRDWDDDDWDRDDDSRNSRDRDSRNDRDDRSRKDRDDEWRGDHDWKAVIERVVKLRPTGNNTLRIELRSKPGTHLSVMISGTGGVTDTTPPTIAATAAPAANGAGWNRGDVQVTFVCSDSGSGVSVCPPARLVNTEGRAQVIAGTATDKAGNTATASVTLNIDKTAPTILGSVTPAPNEFGWVNQNATVSFACTDALSGVATCSAPVTVSAEGGSQSVPGAAADVAGNTATASVAVSLDKVAPVITAVMSPAPNAQGWNRGDVTVTFTCTDGNSGIASCPAPMIVSTDGAGQQVRGIARDRAGNTASTSVVVNMDKTAPVVSVLPLPAANANGWNNSNVTVSFTCSDAGAGVASCPDPVTLTTEGAQQVISREVTDKAGNTATATAVINIDKSVPTLTATALPAPNANGWNDTNVTVTFTCADQLSGIATCPAPVTAPEGAQQSVSGSAVDKAGNTASASITLNVDKTPVSIRADVQPPANAAGWNNTNAVVTFVCQDTGSGVGTCPPPASVTLEGAGQVFSGTGNDLAGNQSTASATVNVDRTPPQISGSVTPAPNADGWINRTASVAFVCADPGGSGIASCPAPAIVGEGAGQQIGGTAVDVAGNRATADVAVSVDATPPTIVASISPVPSADGWITQDATVTFTCSDAGSGIATCPAARTVTAEGANQVVTGTAVDRAGNTAVATVTLNILKTPITITATVDPPPNAAGWNRSAVIVTFTCAGNGSNPCPAPVTVSTEGAGQVVTRQVTSVSGSVADASVTLNIDKTPPTVTIASPAAGSTLTKSPAALSGSALDALSGISAATCGGTPMAPGAGGALSCAPTLVVGENPLVLTATDAAGNVGTAQVSVTFASNRSPVANAGGPYPGVVGTAMFLSAAGSSDPDHDALTFAWDFGDGSHGTGLAPTHTYATARTYTVTLTVTDAGNASSTATATANVTAANRAPATTAGGPYAGSVGTPVAFLASASDADGDPLSYQWNFGDGMAGAGAAPTHAYKTAGTYAIAVTVSDGRGGSAAATTQAVITAPNRPPTVTIAGPYAGFNGSPLVISATGSDPDGDTLGYVWDFGDGGSGVGPNVNHTFGSIGSYIVTVTVNDGRGGTASASATASVAQANRAPHAAVGGPYTGQARTRIAFNASSSADPDGDSLTYSWEFGDGTTGAGASPNHGYAAAGNYTVKVTVEDGRGGRDVATASVAVTAAAIAINQQPVSRPGGPYSGEAGRVLALNGSASSDPDADSLTYGWDFGDGSQGTGSAPAHEYASAGVYPITLTVGDGQGHTHAATTSATIAPAADRAPPSVSISAPVRVLPGADVVVTAAASDNVAVASVTFEVDGASPDTLTQPPYQRTIGVPPVAAPGARIEIRATAVDTAGNASVALATITIDAAPDIENPTVTLNAPAQATPGSPIHLTATAADNVGIASVEFSAEGASIAAVPAAPYDSTYRVPSTATPGSTLTFSARASDFTGNHADATASVVVVENTDTIAPIVTVAVPPAVAPGATLSIAADATDAGGVSGVAFYVEGVRVGTAAQAPYAASFAVPATATPGSILHVEARATDFAGLEGRAAAQAMVIADGKAFVIGEVFDDASGLLLEGATIALTGSDASGRPYTETARSDARGRFLIRAAAGRGVLSIRRAGMTSVDRPVDLRDGAVIELLDSRLTPLGKSSAVSGVLGGVAATDAATIAVPAGAAAGPLTLTLTAVSQQGLEGPLPAGWSPVSVIDIAPHGIAGLTGAALALPNAWHFAGATSLVLVRWDEDAAAWRAIGDATVATDERTIQGAIDAAGEFAVLLADTQPSAPVHPNAGELLTGVAPAAVPADALSLVSPQPKVIFYSPGVKSDVAAGFTSTAPLPSGTVLWSRVTESYRFASGSEIHPEPFTADLVFYQRATDPRSQAATSAVSPSLTFEPLTLADGVITVELFARPESAALISTVGPDGGVLTAPTGESIRVPPGAGAEAFPLQITGLGAGELGMPMPAGIELLGALRVGFTGTLAQPAIVSVPAPASLNDTTGILLVRLQEIEGSTRMALVGGGHVAGDRLVSDLALNGASQTFEGVRVAGRYAFVHTSALVAFAAGTVTGVDGAPFTGALVSTPALPIVALSRGAAGYIAAAEVGDVTFTARDLVRADAGSGAAAFAHPEEVVALDLILMARPPRVTSVIPSKDSTNVAPTTAVVITFSEAIDPATVSGSQVANIVLAGSGGAVVPATLILSSNNSVATLRPTAPLDSNATYTAIVAAGIKDLSGYEMGAAFSAAFTTLDTLPPPPPPAGSITAAIPLNGSTTIRATQGTAGAHDRVSIVNLRTGQISPVLLDANGGFSTTVAAGIKDKLQLKIVDAAGNATTVDLPRFSQTNGDGSVSTAIGPEGGRVTGASGEVVDVKPGTFKDGAVVTVKMVAEADFPVHLSPRDLRTFSFTAGVRVDFGGATPLSYVNVGIPLQGGETEDDQWVVAQVVDNVVGATRLSVIDTARVIGGHITTSSPPCPGMTGAGTYGFLKPGRPVGVLYGPLDRGLPAAIFAPFLVPGMISLDVSADSLWGAYDSINGVVDSIAPYVANAQDIVTALTGPGAYTCLPSLSGSVTVSANRVDLELGPGDVTDNDVEIVVKNVTRGGPPTRLFRPFGAAVNVEGSDSDDYEVQVVDYRGEHRSVGLAVTLRSFVGATVTGLLPGDTRIVVRNETRNVTESAPYNGVSGVTTVHLLIEGTASDDYSVEIRGAAPRTAVPAVTAYPFGAGHLVAHGIFGSIDPTLAEIQAINATLPPEKKIKENGVRWVALRNLTETAQRALVHLPPLDLTILDTDAGVIGTVVGGAFEFPFDGKLTDTYEVRVYYNNGQEEAVTVPNFHISVTDPRTNEVVRRVSGQTPAKGKPIQIDLGAPGTGPASLAFTASALTRIDPTLPIALEFSSALDSASVTASMAVYDDLGNRVAGQWVLTNGGRTAVFNAGAALQLDAKYHIVLSGVRDAAGRHLAATTLPFTTFKPTQLSRLTLDTEGVAIPVKDLGFIRQVATPKDRWLVVAVSGNQQGNKLHTIDVTDPVAPIELGHAAGGSYKRRVALAQTEVNYINYEVPLVAQQTGMSCWAASFAMIVGWADQQPIDPSQIAGSLGYWYQYQHGLDGYDRDMFTQWHMVPEPPQSYSVAKFRDLLEQYGPLWVTSSVPSIHTRVITGMFGDGTPDGTMLLFNDPWEQGMSDFTPSNKGSQYSRTFSRFVTEMESLVPLWNRVDILPFLEEQCVNGDNARCLYIADPHNIQLIAKCTAGDAASCVQVNLPGAYGTYVAHLAAKPSWVPPAVTSSLTVADPTQIDPSCKAHIAGSAFTGDLAVASSWNIDDTYMTFFDVTDPVNPCVVGGKLLTANPERPNTFTAPGTVHIQGSARGVATIRHEKGFAAYVAESDAGVFAADIGRNIPEPQPASRKTEGLYSGDVMDVATFRDRVLALNNNFGGDASLDVLTADLAPVASVALGTFDTLAGVSKVHRLITARQVPVDRNHDGAIGSDETFDLAFAAGGGGVTIIDISDLDDPQVIGRVALPGIIRELAVDDTGRLLMAGGDRTKFTNGDEVIFFVNLADPFAASTVDLTTGRDTRVSYVIPYPGGVSGFKIDSTKGRVYVGWPGEAPNSGGVDVWAFTQRGMQNRAPLAVAGVSKTVAPGSTVRLDGTASSDPDGDNLAFEWAQIAGDPVTISDPTAQEPVFTAPDVDGEVLAFSLVARDASTVSRPSIVTITVHR